MGRDRQRQRQTDAQVVSTATTPVPPAPLPLRISDRPQGAIPLGAAAPALSAAVEAPVPGSTLPTPTDVFKVISSSHLLQAIKEQKSMLWRRRGLREKGRNSLREKGRNSLPIPGVLRVFRLS